jgi:hypothetical protein
VLAIVAAACALNVRVGASVGHGQEEGTVVLELEVLIGELLAIDRFSSGALYLSARCPSLCRIEKTYVAAGEVTTLKHELGDHAVEL